MLPDQNQQYKFGCFYTMSVHKNHFKKENIWGRVCLRNIQNFKLSMKYFTVSWLVRNTNFGVFIQCQYTRTILRKKNMGQSLFKKHSKFQNFDEIFYCGMTRIRNTILNYCGLCRCVKVIKPREIVGQSLFKKSFKISKFQ